MNSFCTFVRSGWPLFEMVNTCFACSAWRWVRKTYHHSCLNVLPLAINPNMSGSGVQQEWDTPSGSDAIISQAMYFDRLKISSKMISKPLQSCIRSLAFC